MERFWLAEPAYPNRPIREIGGLLLKVGPSPKRVVISISRMCPNLYEYFCENYGTTLYIL